MSESCIYDVMGLPKDILKRVLPKASTRSVTRLITAYPRSLGESFLEMLSKGMSPVALEFLNEEIHCSQLPSLAQIRDAEREIMKLIHEDHQELVRC